MIEVVEIFGPTIQGEGKYIGNPSVFVRFGNCNMSCLGFNVDYETPSGIKKLSCDSYHASDIAFQDSWEKYESSKPIIHKINTILPSYKVDIVLTGGEPLLYWNNEEFQKLLHYYISHNYKITIETNSSLNIDLNDTWHKDIVFSMSVKLSNSKEKLQKRININTISKIINKNKDSYLKFVLDKQSLEVSSIEIDEILNQIPKCDVYLMPMGDIGDDINNNALSIIELCLKKGYKYSDRLHIRIWDNKRGV